MSAQLSMPEPPQLRNVVPGLRSSLRAKRERMLDRPIIAEIQGTSRDTAPQAPDILGALDRAAELLQAGRNAWHEDPDDGTCSVRVTIDYENLWRDREKEVLEAITGTLEGAITLLTVEQANLLVTSPGEFLALHPAPETLELAEFRAEEVGNRRRVVSLTFATAPTSREQIRYLAIVPNLVQIERQLDALQRIEDAPDDGPLGPLRALVGLCGAGVLHHPARTVDEIAPAQERLDEFQKDCVGKATTTPHFAVIQGPPGSGKTTVISGIIRRASARGERVLVVSPTHVAVDNVVEKLTPECAAEGPLEPNSFPVRYAARKRKLSERALAYWVGSKKQHRGATIGRLVERQLCKHLPLAQGLFALVDEDAAGQAPLSSALTRLESVICGTPIGVLSYDSVRNADPGTFDLLIVDEVSKMTLPEFLAIAVKARRWALVGDPQQLPPFNGCEENAVTLDDILSSEMELACSVGAVLERIPPAERADQRLIVVAKNPVRTCTAVRAQLLGMERAPSVALLPDSRGAGVVICAQTDLEAAADLLLAVSGRDYRHNPRREGTIRVLVEKGLEIEGAPGRPLVDAKLRAGAAIFEKSYGVYHAQPWCRRSRQELDMVTYRAGIARSLPSALAVAVLQEPASVEALGQQIAERFALNAVAVYDWLTGIPAAGFDTAPLLHLGAFSARDVVDAVRPFTGVLKKQYRMHASISRVPREMFYFGEALHDGKTDPDAVCRVRLLQVTPPGDAGELNPTEADTIVALLRKLDSDPAAAKDRPTIMLITPYTQQEALLGLAVDTLRRDGAITNLEVSVCTLDKCQGREADYVFISLVRSGRGSPFMNLPKRWNVALTRAMKGLFIVGDIAAYLKDARNARPDPRTGHRRLSLLARVLEAYDRQIKGTP